MRTHLLRSASVIIALSLLGLSACSPPDTAPKNQEPQSEDISEEEAIDAIEEIASTTPPANDVPSIADHYGDDWAVTGGWPGEYPAGFSILKDNIVLKAHPHMNPLTEANIDCPVPKFATYQQWNHTRAEADDLDFVVATKIFTITMQDDLNIKVPDPKDLQGFKDIDLRLKSGDTLSYLRYLGEGFAIIKYQGTEYQIDEQELHSVSDINDAGQTSQVDLWLELPCADADKTRAWVLYDEVIRQDGVGPAPIFGYGVSQDITQKDIAGIKELMAVNAELREQ
ncbi:hypothetical protein [Hirschia litorea]|uniref:Lipoprotein n=1 Tax=Hirschia litorea TaxID=1199156 RepID=A0ABW2IL65_9PROT